MQYLFKRKTIILKAHPSDIKGSTALQLGTVSSEVWKNPYTSNLASKPPKIRELFLEAVWVLNFKDCISDFQ